MCRTKCVVGDVGLFYLWGCPRCYREHRQEEKIKELENRLHVLERMGGAGLE